MVTLWPHWLSLLTQTGTNTQRHTTLTAFSRPCSLFCNVSLLLCFQLQFPLVFVISQHHLSDLPSIYRYFILGYSHCLLRPFHACSYLFSDNPFFFYLSVPLITSIHTPALRLCAELRFGHQKVSSQRHTHRTRGSQPHKSPWVEARVSRIKNAVCLYKYLSVCTCVCGCMCVWKNASEVHFACWSFPATVTGLKEYTVFVNGFAWKSIWCICLYACVNVHVEEDEYKSRNSRPNSPNVSKWILQVA